MPPVITGPSPRLRIHLLGGFRVERDGDVPPVTRWRRHAAQVVVKLLAVTPGHRLHRDEVVEACWPDADPESASRNLRVTLHAARHTLQPELAPRAASAYLRTEGDMLALDRRGVVVDLDEAEERSAGALRERGDRRLAALEEAAGLVSAELLPEDRYAAWAGPARAAQDRLRERVLLALADTAAGAGAQDRAVDVLQGLLAADPLSETAHLALIRVLLATGQRRPALAAYHACRDVLAAELGASPGSAIEELHQEALAAPRAAGLPGSGAETPAAFPAPTAPLRGRSGALAELTRAGAPVILVSGEAGIGKTRLVAEAARLSSDAGRPVLWGAGHEAEGHTPYGAFADALDGHLTRQPARRRAELGTVYPELVRLLPALGTSPVPPPGAAEYERARLFRAFADFLADISASDPALVVLDDLHAADPASGQLLHHLARVSAGRWQLIATYREDGLTADDPRRGLFSRLASQGLARRLELMRLPRTDCDAMLRDMGADDALDLERIYHLSRGNPLFAVELTRAAQHDGGRLPAAGGLDHIGLPAAVRDLVEARLAALPPAARELVDLLAVAGAATPLAELLDVAAAVGHPPTARAELIAGLDAACTGGIVAEHVVHRAGAALPGYSFRHPLVELACRHRTTLARRRQIHAAFVDAVLHHRPGAVDAVTFHLREADDPRAVDFLWQAGRRAAGLYANDSALDYFGELVTRLDAAGDPSAADARRELAGIQRRMGRYAQAEQSLAAAIDGYRRAGRTDQVALAAAALSEVLAWSGRPQEGLDLLAGLPRPGRGADGEAPAAYELALMVLQFGTGDYEAALRSARRGTSLARGLTGGQGPRLLARGLGNQAVSLSMLGRLRAAWTAAAKALPVAEKTGDPRLIADVASELAELAQLDGRFSTAREYAERARSLALGTGDRTAIVFKHGNLGRICLRQGDMAAAVREIRLAEATSEELPGTWCRVYALANLGELYSWTGDVDVARAHLAQALHLADRIGDGQARAGARAILAELEVREGQAAAALRLLAVGHFGTAAQPGRGLRRDPLRAWAYLAGGRPERAEQLAARTAAAARARGERLTELPALRVRGAALTALGRPREALRVLNSAAETARRLPFPLELAHIQTARADALTGTDARAAAAARREGAAIRGRLRDAAARAFAGPAGGEAPRPGVVTPG